MLGPEARLDGAFGAARDPAVEVQGEHLHTNRHYHGSYPATAVVTTCSGPAVLASLHASPKETEPAVHGWEGREPQPRDGGGDPRHSVPSSRRATGDGGGTSSGGETTAQPVRLQQQHAEARCWCSRSR